MEIRKFDELITRVRLNACASCDSYSYMMPLPITREIDSFLVCFGPLIYPLDKVQIIKINNDVIRIDGRVGQNEIRVKFKVDKNQRILFETQLAGYLQTIQGVSIIL